MENAQILRSKVIKQPSAQIQCSVCTSRALIGDGSDGRLASVRDGQGATTVGTRVARAELRRVEGNDKVGRNVVASAGAETDIVECSTTRKSLAFGQVDRGGGSEGKKRQKGRKEHCRCFVFGRVGRYAFWFLVFLEQGSYRLAVCRDDDRRRCLYCFVRTVKDLL